MPIIVDLGATVCTPFTSAGYTNLKANVAAFVARSDLTAYIPTFIDHAVSRINRTLRIRPMEKAISVALDADGRADVPCDFIALKNAYLFKYSGTPPGGGNSSAPYLYSDITNVMPLEVTSDENLFADWEWQRDRTNRPRVSIVGSTFVVHPYVSDSPNLGGMYYARFQPLSDSNTANWLTQNVPDLVLYGACLEAAIFVKDQAMLAYWEPKYTSVLEEVQKEHRSAKLSGSSLYPSLRVV